MRLFSRRLRLPRRPSAPALCAFAAVALCAALFLKTGAPAFSQTGARLIVCLLLGAIAVTLCSRRITGRRLSDVETAVVAAVALGYFAAAFMARHERLCGGFLPNSLLLPQAAVTMLLSILIDARLSLAMALALPLCAFASGAFDTGAYVVAVASAFAGALGGRGARRRGDLAARSLALAAVNALAAAACLSGASAPPAAFPPALGAAAANGLACGALALGILPLFENILRMATPFKLVELLDTGAPLLRRLENAAPGTYNHSMEVAALAEAACREIGANALLARVGAYYHDIGKTERPDYFAENQGIYNKHNELNPRLSATVIRSHVKQGVEKARSCGLPAEVVEIVGSHHGDGLITWFYNEAVRREGEGAVNKEDFCYPGSRPRTREAAVVMLADITEAACRTLDKPSPARLEKFIATLVDKKTESGQLASSDLTFRELELIKKTFLRVLVARYHARIEYPGFDPPGNP